jgi:hypothetical protein
MKKIIFYLLFSIFIYQIGGYIISFSIMKYSIKSEMKSKIKKSLNANEYQFFNLNKISKENSFKWEKKDKEFWYNGRIYDIVKIEKSGILKCIDDIQEKKLFQNLDSYVNGFFTKNPNGKKAMQSINSLFFAVFLPSKEIVIPQRYCILTTSIPTDIVIFNTDRTLSVVSPPPRFS